MFPGLKPRHWRAESREDGVLLLWFDRAESSVNTMSGSVLAELDALLERIALEPPKGMVVASAKPAGFIVGADIHEFEAIAQQGRVQDAIERGQRILDRLSRLPCRTVAAIHGHCMGGGTELALACRFRVASSDPKTRIGLPEIKLGIIPGWGGSVRLPRLIGAPQALELMLTGRTLSAEAARAAGLVDAVVAPDALVERAAAIALRGTKRPLGQRLRAWSTNTWLARQIIAPMVLKQTARKARKAHYPAPFALIETWRRASGDTKALLKAEALTVTRLAATPTATNLVRVYFLMEAMKSLGGKTEHGIMRVQVVGAGVMGADIAATVALAGFDVGLQDRELGIVEQALARVAPQFDKRLKTPERIAAGKARLTADVDGTRLAETQLLIEAIFENADAKKALYAKVEPFLPADAILASNTSSIATDTLAVDLARPGQFVGLHFFNPVAQMPLVEIVRHPGLSPDVEKRAAGFVRALDKLPLPVAGTPGFLVNRILMPYLLEAIRAHAEGIPGPVIDRAAKNFGMPMGPIELSDVVGLDVAASVGRILAPFLGLDLPEGIDAKLAAGKRGKKDGEGLYVWTGGRAVKPEIPAGYSAPDDLEDRLLLPLVNEAVACLADGVVDSEDLLDAGVIFGTGFAPFRGGPLRYIRDTGAAVLLARLAALQTRHGARFAPRHGWERFMQSAPPAAAFATGAV